jgi:hypothetical protein
MLNKGFNQQPTSVQHTPFEVFTHKAPSIVTHDAEQSTPFLSLLPQHVLVCRIDQPTGEVQLGRHDLCDSVAVAHALLLVSIDTL